ncbi:hypothetical protein PHLGIDRAFT_448657 [Phlebiopsis gigantea 11061_1 CR5-6]|uniref:Uncharacterized protein n=1 Tax=Phlebiopsis gigantea (strain 11061_1 CR5-6) TaxID=745531 RepID=A0A0C3RXN4_PHLG1|nr:hypothetical protein PHLGIDRAFT_448657 [Phlebiopsis gigantea 11061_1 CR5-6]
MFTRKWSWCPLFFLVSMSSWTCHIMIWNRCQFMLSPFKDQPDQRVRGNKYCAVGPTLWP